MVVYFAFTGRLEDYLLPQAKRTYDEFYDRDIPGTSILFYFIFFFLEFYAQNCTLSNGLKSNFRFRGGWIDILEEGASLVLD